MLDYNFLTVWKKVSEEKTSSLSDEVIKVRESDGRFTYFVPFGSDVEYNQCNSHSIKIMGHDEFVKEYSFVRKFYPED